MSLSLDISIALKRRGRTDSLARIIASIFRDSDGFTTPLSLDQYFSDTAGTTVTTDTGPIALALDSSRGLKLGPELRGGGAVFLTGTATPATYDNITGEGFVERVDISNQSWVRFAETPDSQNYEVDITCLTGTIAVRRGPIQTSVVDFTVSAGNSVKRLVLGANGLVVGQAGASGQSTFVVNSVRELPGNHLTQTSATFRPTLNAGDILFDGGDDRLVSPYVSGNAGSLFARFNGATASSGIMGARGTASGNRSILALSSSGQLAAGVGDQAVNEITAGPDLRNEWHSGGVTWDGTTVKLYLDGAEIYSAPQVGDASSSVPLVLGAIATEGSPFAFWNGRIRNALAVDRPLTPSEITKLTNKWSA